MPLAALWAIVLALAVTYPLVVWLQKKRPGYWVAVGIVGMHASVETIKAVTLTPAVKTLVECWPGEPEPHGESVIFIGGSQWLKCVKFAKTD